MNPLTHAAAEQVSSGWPMSLVTVVFLGIFLGWTWWAWRPANREYIDQLGRMVLDDEPTGGKS